MKLRLLLFLFSLLLSLHTSFSAPIPAQVLQTPTDHPNDKIIGVKLHNGEQYCYAPIFTEGDGYVYIDKCNSPYVKKARHDLFQRVSWNIDGVWLCMTAPNSVTGLEGKSTADWGYLLLRPCVINNPNQRWIIKDRSFHTADGRFRVKDHKWYAYISKNEKDYYDHHLTFEMMAWTQTISPPGNLSSKTFVGWAYVTQYPPAFRFYYLRNNVSIESETPALLYYNPENGHIAQYYTAFGGFYCMVSQQSAGEDWNWVTWQPCTDTVPSSKNSAYWDLSQLNGTEGIILDYKGNVLRVARYGSHWGVPYTVSKSYIEKDTTHSPLSSFTLSRDIEIWNRYVNGNLGKTLTYCPAPGKKKNATQVSTAKTRTKRSLPPDFQLTEQWMRRLWDIARSNIPGSSPKISFCGVCMLHTMQMLAELQEDYISGSRQTGGYFFNTRPGVDPFISFRNRFPVLTERLEATISYNTVPWRANENVFTRTSRVSRAIALILLPRYDWRPSNLATTEDEIRSELRKLLRFPPGTLWYVVIIRSNRDRTSTVGHVQPILRTEEGLVIIPTNAANISWEEFRRAVTATRDVDQLISELSLGGTRTLYSLVTYQMAWRDEIPLNFYISQRNCTGEGDHRRGNGQLPRASLLNQCSSGRCAIQ
ncbi:DUF1561 family protein [Bartonella bacilliformis]|uniref:DUF1561 family protein n=1 Tax=Bartonella bacilliformis TaxID=774 RepID=UPI00049FFDDE|nr:DUF1561 family protein [Bartonella bacilliformis]KEG16546.1 hypothetical protein H705_00416 [Bartonella bacilliformis Cond044]